MIRARDRDTRLETLPLRALVAFALRCGKRVEVLAARRAKFHEAYAAGVDLAARFGPVPAAVAGADAALAVAAALGLLFDSGPSALAGAAVSRSAEAADAAGETDGATAAAMSHDLDALARLDLGSRDGEGEPIRWDDPRLGPLWPDGPPAWHVEAEAQCRAIEDQVRQLGEPPMAPPSEAMIARDDNWKRLDRRLAAGELDQYGGGYVISDGDTIFAHGWNLVEARDQAEAAARTAGVDVDYLVDYFVPAID